MGINLVRLLTGTNSTAIQPRVGASVAQARGVNQGFKTAGYASVPYERAPQVVDTVPTRDANGRPLLPGYETATRCWTC